ncbi:unnamed protein product [Oppiella nova]|uniref:C2H2-type domain-containing protein n=1 Tax=Oppiella nova TaxID=334625 RepID=A0A7R9QQZ8_9ACAR|nr:unnamed protein product [Oppiella nova]CAG2172272.1 unnamed protein product [Oppiella nova]
MSGFIHEFRPGCEAVFRSASSRIRHKVVHRGTADFTCHWDGCGKSFKFKGNFIFVMPSVVQLWAMVWDGGQWTVDYGCIGVGKAHIWH